MCRRRRLVVGLLLLICWVIFVTATLRSLGPFGVVLLLALFAALVWLAVQNGWLHLNGGSALAWIAVDRNRTDTGRRHVLVFHATAPVGPGGCR